MNRKLLALIPMLFVVAAISCGGKSGNPNAGYGDIDATVFASDGKTALQGYSIVLTAIQDVLQLLQVVSQDSQPATDKNGTAHLRIEFVNPPQLSSANMGLLVFPPGCLDVNCAVAATPFFVLQVGQTKTVTITTDVSP